MTTPGGDEGKAIKVAFDAYFESYGMALPESVLSKEAGQFDSGGWDVEYRFADEDGKSCLDIYASHRRTNDRLYRVYADGRVECIASTTEDAENDRAFYAEVDSRIRKR